MGKVSIWPGDKKGLLGALANQGNTLKSGNLATVIRVAGLFLTLI